MPKEEEEEEVLYLFAVDQKSCVLVNLWRKRIGSFSRSVSNRIDHNGNQHRFCLHYLVRGLDEVDCPRFQGSCSDVSERSGGSD
jgi:hypothetical protein